MAEPKEVLRQISSNGLSAMLIGDIPADGGMCSFEDLEQLGFTYKDSASYLGGDPTTENIFVEEVTDPIDSFDEAGISVLKYQMVNYNPNLFKRLIGGVISVDTDGRTRWSAPLAGNLGVHVSVCLVNLKNHYLEIPHGKLFAKENQVAKRKGIDLLDITITELKPAKVGLASHSRTYPAGEFPVVPAGG